MQVMIIYVNKHVVTVLIDFLLLPLQRAVFLNSRAESLVDNSFVYVDQDNVNTMEFKRWSVKRCTIVWDSCRPVDIFNMQKNSFFSQVLLKNLCLIVVYAGDMIVFQANKYLVTMKQQTFKVRLYYTRTYCIVGMCYN